MPYSEYDSVRERLRLFRQVRAGGPCIVVDDPYADREWYVDQWKRALMAIRHGRFYDPVAPYPWTDDPYLRGMEIPVATFGSFQTLSDYGPVQHWEQVHLVEDPEEIKPDRVFIFENGT